MYTYTDRTDTQMPKYYYIVQVHPVELGQPNLAKVKAEREFETKEAAEFWIHIYNSLGSETRRAVYYGCVNDETGELVDPQ